MITFTLNKLVRDAIPQIMQADNQDPKYHVLDGRALHVALLHKLKEEADEALLALDDDNEFEKELADIYEVVDAITQAKNLQVGAIEKIQGARRDKRGGFSKGYFLETITLNDDSEWVEYYRSQPQLYIELTGSDP